MEQRHEDLEAELMDLDSNEHVYLPPAPPSASPLPLPLPLAPPQTTIGTTTTARWLSGATELLGRATAAVVATVTTVTGESSSAATAPAPGCPTPHAPAPASPPSSSAASAPSSVAGWYEHVELLLAGAEDRYRAWQENLEVQGSITEEEYRQAELDRLQRRRTTIADLRSRRSLFVQAILRRPGAIATTDADNDAIVDVEELLAKLGRVVDESARQLERLHRENALWTRLVADLPPDERDYVARAADEMFAEQMKYLERRDEAETRELVTRHLQSLFCLEPPMKNGQRVGKTMQHSLRQTLSDFAEIFHAAYAPALRPEAPRVALAELLPLMAADVNQFAMILVRVLRYKYPFVPERQHSTVHRAVMEALFEHLQPTLHGVFVAAFAREDAFLGRLAAQHRNGGPTSLEAFGIRRVFRLDGSWRPAGLPPVEHDGRDLARRSIARYGPVIERLNALPSHRSPWVKAELLSAVCVGIDRAIKGFYQEQVAQPSPEEVNMAAEDLAAILGFVLISAPGACAHVVTQVALLSCFMAQETMASEVGFAVATTWAAVSHLCHLT